MRFTIIIPAYNASRLISIPLESLEGQTYKKDFQVLIIDDGSTDNLKDSIKDYLDRNPTWEYHKKTNGNWGSVINYVLDNNLIKGEYVTILDSDDYYLPNMLETVSWWNEDIVLTGINRLSREKFRPLPVSFQESIVPKERAYSPMSMPHGKFYRKELFVKAPRLKEKRSYQDTVLYLSLVYKSHGIRYIKKPLAVWWFDRPGNSTQETWDDTRANIWLDTCESVLKETNNDPNAMGWVMMYLWELRRKYKGKLNRRISLDKKKARFDYLPRGTRWFVGLYFKSKARKFIKKTS